MNDAAGADTAATRRARRAPPLLWVPAAAVAAAACLPLAYLAVRVGSDAGDALDAVWRARTLELLGDTFLLVVLVTVAATVTGAALAWLVTRTDLPGRRLLGVAAALPLVIPSYVLALALVSATGPRGLVSDAIGVELPRLHGLAGATLVLTLSTYPYVYLLAAAAFRALDPALEEAARSLGRTTPHALLRVTLPVVRPSLGAGALLVALYVLSDFGVVSLIDYDSLTRVIFLQYRALFDRTPAAALAFVLVILTIAVLVVEARLRGRARVHRSSPGAARRQRPHRLGRLRWPALAAAWAVIALALVAPIVVLCWWLARAVDADVDIAAVTGPALSSVAVAVVAAAVAAIASLPVALLAVRHPSRASAGAERATYAANALPGLVIALALVFFAARYVPAIYQTLPLLAFAYVVRFLPQSVGATHAALRRVDPRLEEAARGLGRGPRHAFASVTLRLIAPGMLAGAALVYLSAMKELPATLVLAPIGFESLSTELWSAARVSRYADAAVPALVLIALAIPFAWLVVAHGDESSPGGG